MKSQLCRRLEFAEVVPKIEPMEISIHANSTNKLIPRIDHTHALASPSKCMFLRSQRTINLAQAVELEITDRSGLAPKESVGLLARKVGGVENLGFIL
ncbi:hypothetical protein V6N12_034577 [Hibiscus sabdariffa]|uniref:Uncharacterized protein n=1 Tax=Hibiscus sabdariffa TaxID=183260 RepID=A0ABR2DJ69_9ROSI